MTIVGILSLLLVIAYTFTSNEKTPREAAPIAIEAQVIGKGAQASTLLIRHEGVAGLPSGELTVAVGSGDMGYSGRRVRGVLIRSEDQWRLERIWPVDEAMYKLLATTNRQLRRDTVTRGQKVYRSLGEYLPTFALYDQDGKVILSHAFRGKDMVLNFIFTRCAVPTMCPAATANMAALQRQAQATGIEDLELVSISFDPEYDTPGVLRAYAETRGLDLENFTLLTGPKEAIRDLLKQFGILTVNKDGAIQHTMATLLIDKKGKLRFRKEGSRWTPTEFLEQLNALDAG